MNAGFLKELYEKLPGSVKMLGAPIIRRGLIANPVFLEQYNELVQTDNMPEEEKDKLQFQRLKDLCVFVYENAPYYHDLFDERHFDCYHFESAQEYSEKIPCLTKEDVLANYDRINVAGIRGGLSGQHRRVLRNAAGD